MSQPWHDINAPGLRQKPKQPESNKPAVTDDVTPPPPKKPLVKLSDGKFVLPDEGAEINKKCSVQVNVEYLDDSAKSMKKVTFSLYSNYNGQTSNLSHYADGYEKDGIAQAELILYPPPGYQDGDNVDYFFKAEHIRGEKVIDSEDITLPQETTMIVLQKGHYDENGAAAYDKPQSGDNFKPNNVVKKLQGDLITTAFLPEGSDDGFFGDQTDKAVNDFQDYAIKSIRMKRSIGKTETTDTTLDQQAPDGIVGKKTRDELDKWLQNSWVKPIPTLRHGEYDDTGVQNGKGQRGTDDHHQGTPVVEAQQNLQKVGIYSDGAIDGWFYDKMLDAVKLFQDVAEKGKFIISGVLSDIGEKLSGHCRGEYCIKTKEFVANVQSKNGTVPNSQKATKTSENGKQFIMLHEGFKPKPYNDSAGHATIGYGTLLHKGAVTDEDNKKYADGITKEDAKKLLDGAIVDFENSLNNAVKVPLNQNQFDALIDWTYNFGPGRLIEQDTKWLRELNSGNYDAVPGDLLSWNKETKNGVKVVSEGLTKRRQDEGELFKKAE